MSDINTADLIVVAIVLLSALFAFVRGFIREVLGVAAWIGAAAVTLYGFNTVRGYFREFISIATVADIAAGAVLFLVSLVLLSMVSHAISSRVRTSGLGALDRTLGFLFGLARGAVLVCIIFAGIAWAKPDLPPWIEKARTRPLLERGAHELAMLLPREARERGAAAADRAKADGERALELERAYHDLASPPAKGAPTAPGGEYSDQDRRALDRLIQGKQ